MNRILYITPSFPADENDSRCIPALQDFFIERSKRGFQDHIIALSYPCKGNYEWHGHHVESLGWGLPNKFKKWFLIQQATQQILKKIETYNFDLVHSFWLTDASLVAVNLCKQLQIKHLVTVMGQDVVSSYYTRRILVSAPQLVFLSDFQKQQFYISSYPSETIPWGLSEQWNVKGVSKSFDIISVGSLNITKQHHHTVRLIELLKDHFPDIRAAIVGEGAYRDKIQSLIQSKGLCHQIKLLGALSRAETRTIMQQSRILFHTSKFEGFGMVLIEAIACGMSVVSYPVGVAPQLERIFKMKTIKEGAQLVIQILKDNAIKPAEIIFPIERTADQYEMLYKQIILRN